MCDSGIITDPRIKEIFEDMQKLHTYRYVKKKGNERNKVRWERRKEKERNK